MLKLFEISVSYCKQMTQGNIIKWLLRHNTVIIHNDVNDICVKILNNLQYWFHIYRYIENAILLHTVTTDDVNNICVNISYNMQYVLCVLIKMQE